jgi:hypothetical protein
VEVAHTVVLESLATEAVMLKFPPVAMPEASTALVQLEFVYSLMVLAASPVPAKTGELLLEPVSGVTAPMTGAAGGELSSTYKREVDEQGETLPAKSVEVAHTVVLELSATEAVMLKLPPVAIPEARTALVQPELVYSLMVLLASPVPLKTGELLFERVGGVTVPTTGAAGGVLSSM